jgi:hypothetical protein
MQLETFSETKRQATTKWREYKEAAKVSQDPVYKDLRKAYNALKGGKKLIDISKVIQKGGVHEDGTPKLAIAQAKTKTIYCQISKEGNVEYINNADSWGRPGNALVTDVSIAGCLPKNDSLSAAPHYGRRKVKAPVPLVPPRYLPQNLTDDYYILWEVDVWEMVPPTDPWLLKRITSSLFVALHGWDLTPVEKAVLKGRMY